MQQNMSLTKRCLLAGLSLLLAAGTYLPCMHWLFRPAASELVAGTGVAPLPGKLAAHHLRLWSDPQLLAGEIDKMRSANAEWDFMGRSFVVWSLANMALRDKGLSAQALGAMDRIIDQTLSLEREQGMYFFLMPYARRKAWVQQPERSLFVDGEIALMLAMRCLVEAKPVYLGELRRRVDTMAARMEASPSLSAESYPDECWTFCNVTALAAIRAGDALQGTDHSGLIHRWLDNAKARLIDHSSGLLISAYTVSGETIYPPEGSSIWYVSSCLALLDEPFARRQYELAKAHLAGEFLGFGFAREWPKGRPDTMDVDSGLVVPGLQASVGSSGLAFVAAGTFGDVEFLRSLATSVAMAGFGVEHSGGLHYAAGNQVGDAVVLYGLTIGPAWQKIKEARP
jgi:hypothetical protein